jgi:hypothetical protein
MAIIDPQLQVQEAYPPSPPPREPRPNRRPGKEPTSSSQAPSHVSRQASYMMPSMAVPPSQANPTRKGIAWEICPRTPPRLKIEFQEDQRQYPRCPKLTCPQIVPGFAVEMGRNYFKLTVALTNACKEDVYKYEKYEGLERRFWCQLHQDFYSSVVLRKGKAPIVPCKYVDWAYFEKLNDPFFNQANAKCKEFGVKYQAIHSSILAQFHSSLYYDARKIAFFWTTKGVKYGVDYMTFSRLLELGSNDEKRDPIHVEHQLKPNQLPTLFYNPILAKAGNASILQPFYYMMNQFFHATIDAKGGDSTGLRYFACNLLARVMPGGRPLSIMDFIWNELRRMMNNPQKFLPSAPYLIYMIERVTKVTFPNDSKHEALHLRPRSGDVPRAPPLHAGATRNPRFDPAPSYSGASSSSRHGHHDSFIKRALKSIFCMCKMATQEINENRHDIIEIKSHLGLPTDPYHELPEFDDPFAEWDAADEAAIATAHAPLPPSRCRARAPTRSRRSPPRAQEIFDEEEEIEEEEPQDYFEVPDSDEDEDTSADDTQEDDE